MNHMEHRHVHSSQRRQCSPMNQEEEMCSRIRRLERRNTFTHSSVLTFLCCRRIGGVCSVPEGFFKFKFTVLYIYYFSFCFLNFYYSLSLCVKKKITSFYESLRCNAGRWTSKVTVITHTARQLLWAQSCTSNVPSIQLCSLLGWARTKKDATPRVRANAIIVKRKISGSFECKLSMRKRAGHGSFGHEMCESETKREKQKKKNELNVIII